MPGVLQRVLNFMGRRAETRRSNEFQLFRQQWFTIRFAHIVSCNGFNFIYENNIAFVLLTLLQLKNCESRKKLMNIALVFKIR